MSIIKIDMFDMSTYYPNISLKIMTYNSIYKPNMAGSISVIIA